MDDLRECPFCGGDDIALSMKIKGGFMKQYYHAVMYCKGCYAYGARTKTEKTKYNEYDKKREIRESDSVKQEAIAAWNKRAPDPAMQAVRAVLESVGICINLEDVHDAIDKALKLLPDNKGEE